jgi:hypothetical protein
MTMLAACHATQAPAGFEAAIPAVKDLALERMFAVATGTAGARLGGFDQAAAPGRVIVARDSVRVAELGRATVDANGRFSIDLSAKAGDVLVLGTADDPSVRVPFRVRDPAAARAAAVHPPIDGDAGSVPNDLVIAGSHGILVRSGDNAVSPFDLSRGLSGSAGVRIPEVDGRCGNFVADPWFAVPLDDAGERIAVTAAGQRAIDLVDLGRGAIEKTLAVAAPIALDTPFSLARPIDVDGDCNPDTTVTSFVPREPQPIALVGDRLVAGFTSFLAPRVDGSSPPVYLPGVLANWAMADLDRAPSITLLGAFNPQEIRIRNSTEVFVVCSGILDHHEGTTAATTSGAIVVFDVQANAIVDRFDLGDFAPGTVIESNGALWVGSLVKGAVRRIDLVDRTKTNDLVVDDEMVDSLFRLVDLEGGLVGVPSFDTDRLHILDTRTGMLDPLPFGGPLAVGPGRPIFDGLQIVARRPGRRGVDFVEPDLYALSGIASLVTPIELRKVLGP